MRDSFSCDLVIGASPMSVRNESDLSVTHARERFE
jgi:hypothetical protein